MHQASEYALAKIIAECDYNVNFIKSELLTLSVYNQALSMNPKCIWIYPEEHLSHDLCLKVVRQDGMLIRAIPVKCLDENLCVEAVRENPEAINVIPSEFLSYKVWLEAIKGDGIKRASL